MLLSGFIVVRRGQHYAVLVPTLPSTCLRPSQPAHVLRLAVPDADNYRAVAHRRLCYRVVAVVRLTISLFAMFPAN